MTDLLISIDLGTTRLKVAGFQTNGTLQHLVVRRHTERRAFEDGEARRWQSADQWWTDTVSAVRQLLAHLDSPRILGIGLSGRGGAGVFADAAGRVVADPWADDRHRQHADRLREWRADRADSVRLSNYGLALIAKYRWLADRHPARAAKVVRAFYAKDWLLYRLTGAHQTDWSSGPDGERWDPALADLGLPADLLPQPALPWELAAPLSAQAAGALGLDVGVPVAVGAHDGVAANIGAGAFSPGDIAITLGTHAVVRAVTDRYPEGSFRFYCFPPGLHVRGGNALMAGRSVDWVVELTDAAAGSDRTAAYRVLEDAAAGVPAGARGLTFLPYLAGQVAPVQRPHARGALLGMALDHGRAELYRAVLEGGAFAVRQLFEQVTGWIADVPGPADPRRKVGAPRSAEQRRVRVTGGGADSELWIRILTDVIGQSIESTGQAVEARGAAMCLSVALGFHADLEAAARAMVRVVHRTDPDPAGVAEYEGVYRRWETLDQASVAVGVSSKPH